MALVKGIDGTYLEGVQLTDIKHVGDEGDRTAIAHVGTEMFEVYNSIIDGFNLLWIEQMDYEEWKRSKENKK